MSTYTTTSYVAGNVRNANVCGKGQGVEENEQEVKIPTDKDSECMEGKER